MDTKFDELAILKFLDKEKVSGRVKDVFVKLVSSKDIDVYVAAPSENVISTIVSLETSMYINRKLGVVSVSRKGNTIKALLNNEITVFIRVLKPDEAEQIRSRKDSWYVG